jgi:hypothetical protein
MEDYVSLEPTAFERDAVSAAEPDDPSEDAPDDVTPAPDELISSETAPDDPVGGERAPDWTDEAGDDLLVARALQREHPQIDLRALLAQVIELRERQSTLARERQRAEFVRDLREQEDALRLSEPDFDLLEAISRYPAFRALILSGEPVERAFNYIDPERLRRASEQAIVERIRLRNARPQSIGAANASAQPIDPANMSEEELRRLDERVKRGERVTL